MDKWLAYDADACETETFGTLEAAKAWVKDATFDDGRYGPETADGGSFIARIQFRTAVRQVSEETSALVFTKVE